MLVGPGCSTVRPDRLSVASIRGSWCLSRSGAASALFVSVDRDRSDGEVARERHPGARLDDPGGGKPLTAAQCGRRTSDRHNGERDDQRPGHWLDQRSAAWDDPRAARRDRVLEQLRTSTTVLRLDALHYYPVGQLRAQCRYLKMFTARAMTSAAVTNATELCSNISIFAHRHNGIVSVGLKAVALVKLR